MLSTVEMQNATEMFSHTWRGVCACLRSQHEGGRRKHKLWSQKAKPGWQRAQRSALGLGFGSPALRDCKHQGVDFTGSAPGSRFLELITAVVTCTLLSQPKFQHGWKGP